MRRRGACRARTDTLMTLLITEEDVKRLPLDIKAAIPLVENTFRQSGEGTAENPPRYRMPFKKGFMQFGPAALHKDRRAGFKLWANFGGARAGHGYDFLFDMDSGEMLALIHSYWISKYRTSADILAASFPSIAKAFDKLHILPWSNKSTMNSYLLAMEYAEPGKNGWTAKQSEARLLMQAMRQLPGFAKDASEAVTIDA